MAAPWPLSAGRPGGPGRGVSLPQLGRIRGTAIRPPPTGLGVEVSLLSHPRAFGRLGHGRRHRRAIPLSANYQRPRNPSWKHGPCRRIGGSVRCLSAVWRLYNLAAILHPGHHIGRLPPDLARLRPGGSRRAQPRQPAASFPVQAHGLARHHVLCDLSGAQDDQPLDQQKPDRLCGLERRRHLRHLPDRRRCGRLCHAPDRRKPFLALRAQFS